jgi:hypothetical protein
LACQTQTGSNTLQINVGINIDISCSWVLFSTY